MLLLYAFQAFTSQFARLKVLINVNHVKILYEALQNPDTQLHKNNNSGQQLPTY